LADFKIRDVALVHRLGRLESAKPASFIVVVHIATAFGRGWLIDNLQATDSHLEEYFIDGAVWADGEPFPSEMRARRPLQAARSLRRQKAKTRHSTDVGYALFTADFALSSACLAHDDADDGQSRCQTRE